MAFEEMVSAGDQNQLFRLGECGDRLLKLSGRPELIELATDEKLWLGAIP
jgi:hypothetical protein